MKNNQNVKFWFQKSEHKNQGAKIKFQIMSASENTSGRQSNMLIRLLILGLLFLNNKIVNE